MDKISFLMRDLKTGASSNLESSLKYFSIRDLITGDLSKYDFNNMTTERPDAVPAETVG